MMTDFDIVFCNDGVLRASYSPKKPMLSFSLLYEEENKKYEKITHKKLSEFKFWSRWWSNCTYFEQNLTLGTFLMCLEPWAEFFSDLTDVDIASYIAESKKPYLIRENLEESYISLFYESAVSKEVKSNYDFSEKFDIASLLESSRNMSFTGKWMFESKYSVALYNKDEWEHYGIEYRALNELRNVPIYLDKLHYFYTLERQDTDNIAQEGALLEEKTFGIQTAFDKEGDNPIHFIVGEKSHSLDDVVKGFFKLFNYNPQARDQVSESLRQALVQTQDETLSEENIDEAMDEILTEIDNNEAQYAKGALKDVVNHWEETANYWKNMVDVATNYNTIVKIGGFEAGVRPDTRLFNYIVTLKEYQEPPVLESAQDDFSQDNIPSTAEIININHFDNRE